MSELCEESELFELRVREHDLANKYDVCAYVATDSNDFLKHKKVHDKMILKGTTVPYYNPNTAVHITIPNTTSLDKYDVCSHVATDSSDCWSTRGAR